MFISFSAVLYNQEQFIEAQKQINDLSNADYERIIQNYDEQTLMLPFNLYYAHIQNNLLPDISIKNSRLYLKFIEYIDTKLVEENQKLNLPLQKNQALKNIKTLNEQKRCFLNLSRQELLLYQKKTTEQGWKIIFISSELKKIITNPEIINYKENQLLYKQFKRDIENIKQNPEYHQILPEVSTLEYSLQYIIDFPQQQKEQWSEIIKNEIKTTLLDISFVSLNLGIDYFLYRNVNPYFCITISILKSLLIVKFLDTKNFNSLLIPSRDTLFNSLFSANMLTPPMYTNQNIVNNLVLNLRINNGPRKMLVQPQSTEAIVRTSLTNALIFTPQILLYNIESIFKYNIHQYIFEKVNQSLFELAIYDKYNQLTTARDLSDFMCISDRICNLENLTKIGKIIINYVLKNNKYPYVYFEKTGDFYMFRNLMFLAIDKLGINIEDKKCTKSNYRSFIKELENIQRDMLELKEARKFCNFYEEEEFTKRFFIYLLKFMELFLFKFVIKTKILTTYYFMEFDMNINNNFEGNGSVAFNLSQVLSNKNMRLNNGIVALFKKGASEDILNQFDYSIHSSNITFKQLVALIRRKMLNPEFLPLILNKIDDLTQIIHLMAKQLWNGGYDQDTYEDKIDYWIKLFIYESDNVDSMMNVF